MDIFIFAPHWGSSDLAPQAFIDRVKAAGFDGIEMSLPLDGAQRADWLARIHGAGLALVAQQWETVMHPGFDAHRTALGTYLNNACSAKPLFVNSHTGRDIYSPMQNRELIALAQGIAQSHGVPIVHEIHRSRFTAHPMLLLPYLQDMPELELTADLSHWCCVCETLLEDQPENLEATFPHVRHIHARVGHAQGPQVSDFRAPEWSSALEQHLSWWQRIVDVRRAAGAQRMTLTPEFGPVPYTPTLPYSQAPVSNAWELNVAMLELLRERLV